MNFLACYVVAAILFLLLDSVWLGLFANKFYKKQLGELLLKRPNFIAAAVFYVLYIFGVVLFALVPAFDEAYFGGKHAAGIALMWGSIFGLVAYATYDLTNLATLKKWPLKVVIVDMLWGAFATGLVSLGTFLLLH